MAKETVKIPDVGGGDVDVIEVCVKVGDVVAKEDSLIVLESDKASMEIPSPLAGKVLSISVKDGSTVHEGDVILELEVEAGAATQDTEEQDTSEQTSAESKSAKADKNADAEKEKEKEKRKRKRGRRRVPRLKQLVLKKQCRRTCSVRL